jgi:hypothetical protein
MKLPSIFKYADIISDLLKKYSKFFIQEELDYIQQQIPRSYLPWIFKQYQAYVNSAERMREFNPNLTSSLIERAKSILLEDLPIIKYYLEQFENHKQDLRNNNISTNINDYTKESLTELINMKYEKKDKYEESFDLDSLKQAIPIAFEDENWIIFTPQTEEQACIVGNETNWCTTRGSFSDYYSEDNPIYDLVNKKTKRRWQYDKVSGMFFTEDDQSTDFGDFATVYKDQITPQLTQFLSNTASPNPMFLYLDKPRSIEFQVISDVNKKLVAKYHMHINDVFSSIEPPELVKLIVSYIDSFPSLDQYKDFVLTVLNFCGMSIEEAIEDFQNSSSSTIDYNLLWKGLSPFISQDFSFDAKSTEEQDEEVRKNFQQENKTAGLVDTLKNLYQKVFKSAPEEQETEVPVVPDVQPSIEPIEIPYFEKNLPSGISSEDVELVSKPAAPPPPLPGDRRPWTLPIPEDYNPKNDHSYNTFKYLYSLGYRDAIWHLAESHGEYDQCDELNGMSFTTDWLLFASQHNPPSPIYSRSHPDCRCFITCNPPSSPEEIPDDAPGLPLFGTDDQILEFKRKIFANLVPLDVDSQTMAPPEEHLAYLYSSRLKFGKEDKWKENIVPIKTQKDFRLVLPLGLYRPMIEEYIGIKLEENDEMTKSYIYDLNRIVYIPNEFLTTLNVKEDTSREVKPGEYVYIDNSILGIVTRILEDKVFCFIPDFNIIAQVSSYTPLNF